MLPRRLNDFTSAIFISGLSVDRWNDCAHRSKITRELSAVMNHIEVEHPKDVADWPIVQELVEQIYISRLQLDAVESRVERQA